MCRIRAYLLLLLLPSWPALAQDSIDDDIQQKIENVAENLNNEDADYTNLTEHLSYYRERPINLNSAGKDELMELGLLSEIQVNHLLAHIQKNGKLLTIHELQSIAGFDLETIRKILPYVFVSGTADTRHFSLKEMLADGKHVFLFRYQQVLEQQTGFTAPDSGASVNSRYLGSPQKYYARYRFTYSNAVSWGITGEKDAGEEFFTGSQQQGFDFYSAHLFVRDLKFVRALAIGDYTLGFGQGLNTWSGLAYGKGGDAVNIKKSAPGIRPYSSVDENRFFRGAAVTLGFQTLELTAFYSKNRIDANISDTLADGELLVTSLQESGYHSTPSELADKDAIEQTVFGSNLSYKSRRLRLGLTGMSSAFNAGYSRNSELYNMFAFSSGMLSALSADYNIVIKNFNFFGEAALSVADGADPGMAFLNGMLIVMDPRLSLSLLHRHYQRNYQSLFANAFAESTTPANEQGIYVGISARPAEFLSINAYYDHFRFPWLKYQVDAPSQGNEWLAQVNYTPSKKLDLYVRVKQKNKYANLSVPDALDPVVPVRQTSYRFNISYTLSPSFRLRNRVEYLCWDNGSGNTETGFLIYQDLSFRKLGRPYAITLRYALFHTDSYDARIYAYENDIPGVYSIPAYYYKGSRTYVMLSYDITRRLEFWLRWSQTYYSNKDVISEGSLTEIKGNTKTEIKAQVRIKL
ncbi:MAG: helix-hairpin-helix domain-containing protein [Bacteroidota bacterium]